MLERIVWIFIPFYDELKSVTLVFLILSRARVCTISPLAQVSLLIV